ncbi:MAG TPA: 2,3-bisphosphoglycerate-independent phosphoglycerate mutase [Thermoanaerobaculia bacterium]
MTRPLVLVVCDGWGHAEPSPGNAIALARKPVFDRWLRTYPWTLLSASGEDVGLPAGLMGNSEVGHLTLGAGRMVPQDLLRIDLALRDGSFFENSVLTEAIERAAKGGSTLHLFGLLSDGGVHSHERHLVGLLELARRRGLERVAIHVFTDGRDTPPRSALTYIDRLEEALARLPGSVATVSGRYFAMDRDRRWDRLAKAFAAIAQAEGPRASSAREAVESAYARGENDEFIQPTVVDSGAPGIRPGDVGVFFNFRADRARQLTAALALPDFAEFPRGGPAPLPGLVCFTEYQKELSLPVAFPSDPPEQILAQAWERAEASNLRLAETEKYAHVTYFFNGGVEHPFGGEERRLIPSWKGATYDLHPQMSAEEITAAAEEAIASGRYAVLVINYANADMVGHTGKLPETIRAIEVLDACLGRLETATRGAGGLLLMTADHGNAEQMIDSVTGAPHTAHTTNPVPFVLCGTAPGGLRRTGVSLADVAPTILGLQGIPVPREMTGRDLREREP